ncbi:unnamed protein product [Clonostachys rosea]|uniref:Epoxide hydrolase N-terminal domain-containing protein n=1 Tax=Bionectria ochroleuca TaxID=29856 RepID=A0ABY6V031_BIOOC|nr:unnamed protein product [Clonostachys rosea]
MSPSNQPRVLLFDIGGVCVKSPFQVILNYEVSLGIPPGWVNYSISRTAPHGSWHKVERGQMTIDKDFYKAFNQDLHDTARWRDFYLREQAKNPKLPKEVPQLPDVDGEWLFETMMSSSNFPDPWMFPALQKLKASGRYILAALSNTVVFPPGHALHRENYFDDPVRAIFDVFVSSAHVGLRKPDPAIYQLALELVNKNAKGRGLPSIAPSDVVFLDDIGENLKQAKNQGFGTIKVHLGKAYEAVDELEKITGLQLAGNHPKVPGGGDMLEVKAKI